MNTNIRTGLHENVLSFKNVISLNSDHFFLWQTDMATKCKKKNRNKKKNVKIEMIDIAVRASVLFVPSVRPIFKG